MVVPPSSWASGRRTNGLRPIRRNRRSSCSPTRRAWPMPTASARSSLLARADVRRGRGDRVVAVSRSRRVLGPRARYLAARHRGIDRRRQQPAAPDRRVRGAGSKPATAMSCSSAAPRACTRAGAPARNRASSSPGIPAPTSRARWSSATTRPARARTRPRTWPLHPRWSTRCSRPHCGRSSGTASTSTNATSASSGRASPQWPPRTRTRGRAPPTRPDDIRTISADNRAVCFPYPKRMCANIDVDQGAAVLLCSYETAHAAGVPDDRMVFLHAAAEAHDHWFVTERWSLCGIAGDRGDRSGRAGGRGCEHRRRRAHRPLLVLSVGGADRARRTRHRSRRPPAAHRHRRARLRGRAGEQLPDPRRSRRWSTSCARTPTTSGSRPRSVGTSPSTRPRSGRRDRPRNRSAASTCRKPSTPSPAGTPRAWSRPRRRSKPRRSRSSATATRRSAS